MAALLVDVMRITLSASVSMSHRIVYRPPPTLSVGPVFITPYASPLRSSPEGNCRREFCRFSQTRWPRPFIPIHSTATISTSAITGSHFRFLKYATSIPLLLSGLYHAFYL